MTRRLCVVVGRLKGMFILPETASAHRTGNVNGIRNQTGAVPDLTPP